MSFLFFLIFIPFVVSIVFDVVEQLKFSIVPSEEDSYRYNDYKENHAFFKKARKIAFLIIAGITIIICIFNCIYITTEQDIGFTMTFGKTSNIEGAGPHFKLPFITTCRIYDATTKGMAIGYDEENNETNEEDSLMITSDFNFVNTDFYIEYRIVDPVAYAFGSSNPEEILRNVAQASIRNTVGLYDVDSVITTGKSEIESTVKSDIAKKLEGHNTGLYIVNVTIQDAEPPTAEVSAAFDDVEQQKQNADKAVNNAKAEEEKAIPEAEAKADQLIKEAEATKTERINQGYQEVAEFNALYEEYSKNPDTVKKQLYYDAMNEILPNMEIIIGGESKVVSLKGLQGSQNLGISEGVN